MSSLRLNNVPVCTASAGQTVTFKLSDGPTENNKSQTIDTNIIHTGSSINASQWQPAGRKRSSAAGLVLLSTSRSTASVSTTAATTTTGEATLAAVPVPRAHWEFEAELLVLNHPSKIRANYEPVVHVGCVKQAAKLVSVRKMGATEGALEAQDELGNGEKGICRFVVALLVLHDCTNLPIFLPLLYLFDRFRFLYYPEYIISGEAMIIREQRTRGVGTITALVS